jgi:shikimate dehydrogenase
MKSFLSIAISPGGTGSYYYNSYFEHLNVDATYEAVQCSSLSEKITELRKANIAGVSVSMPFKKEIINYLDEIDESVDTAGSCNTVKIVDGNWIGYNTDIKGVEWALRELPARGRVQILGDGSMSNLFQRRLDAEGRPYKVFSRRAGNWSQRHGLHEIVINTTALGTFDATSPLEEISGVRCVVDLSLNLGDLNAKCWKNNVEYVSGLDFYKQVFLKQFHVYTGLNADPEIFDHLTKIR